MKSFIFFKSVAFLCALLVFGTLGCGSKEEAKSKKGAKRKLIVEATAVVSGEISQVVRLNGTVEAFRMAQTASPAEGPVLDLRVREGDLVNVGDVLLTIGRRSGVRARIVSLREELNNTQAELERTKRLVDSAVLPGEQLDSARLEHERIRAALAAARETANDHLVMAPFSGIVSKMLVNEGDFVNPRSGLVEIFDPDTMVLRVAVPEQYVVGLKKEMPVDIELDAFPGQLFSGEIVRLYPYLNKIMRTRTIEISINEKIPLLPGMFGRIRLTLESLLNAVVIPQQALLVTHRGKSIVFIYEEKNNEGKAILREVKAGLAEGDRLQILSGISVGEMVIYAGHERLKDGATVELKNKRKKAESPAKKEVVACSIGKVPGETDANGELCAEAID